MKKLMYFLLVLSFTISAFAAGQKEEPEPVKATGAPVETEYLVSEKPVTFTVHYHSWEKAFNTDWIVFQRAAELTNVSLEGTIPKTATDPKQEFNIMMASGELADIVYRDTNSINKYIDTGAFISLDKLIDEHAPNIKQFFEDHPGMYEKAKAPDGKNPHLFPAPKRDDPSARPETVKIYLAPRVEQDD